MEPAVKRQRGPNYTVQEVNLLMSIIAEHKDTVENKKTDAVTWREKDSAWKKITQKFNSTTGVICRSVESLKKVYENKKKEARKKTKTVKSPGEVVDGSAVNDPLVLSNIIPKTEIVLSSSRVAIPSTSTTADPEIVGSNIVEVNANDVNFTDDIEELIRDAQREGELSKEYTALTKLKLQCARVQLEKLQQEKECQLIENQLRQEILKVELKLKQHELEKALQE